MVQTTRAIVLRAIKHGDKSTVLRAYTERFGLRSYMVRSAGKGTARSAALQPLSRVELVVPEAGEHELRTVRELRIDRPYTRLQQEPVRGVLMLFAQEVFNRTLREESEDAQLYGFLQETLENMDTGSDMTHQPLLLLVGLSRHLGFFPEIPDAGEHRFDLREGYFFHGQAPHEFCMEPAQADLFAELIGRIEAPGETVTLLRTSAEVRRRLLEDLLIYYRLHVAGFGELRSLDVLRAVLE